MAEHCGKKPSAQKAEGKLKKMIKNTLAGPASSKAGV